MQSRFNPTEPAELRRQASLYRRLASAVRSSVKRDQLIALAVHLEETAEGSLH